MSVSPRPDSTLLGPISVERFLRDYWQKKPLLIRRAIHPFAPLVSLAELRALAALDHVESRLVTAFRGKWKLAQGPIVELPRSRRDWTLLVQGVNLYHARLDALQQRFNFLPYTRLDDVMVSYAVQRGSVGAHFDSYDVFLLQAEGRRRWRVSMQHELDLVEGLPLKILKNFAPEHDWTLEPGDMLYLPPHVAHEGVALEASMTYSIGFRAPTYTELARQFLYDVAEKVDLPGRYRDPDRAATTRPARLDDHLLQQLSLEFARIRWTHADIVDFAGRYFSEPKDHVFFTPPAPVSLARFKTEAARVGLRLDPKTKLLHRGSQGFINGESVSLEGEKRRWIACLADLRRLSAAECVDAMQDAALVTVFHDWFTAGWIIKGA